MQVRNSAETVAIQEAQHDMVARQLKDLEELYEEELVSN